MQSSSLRPFVKCTHRDAFCARSRRASQNRNTARRTTSTCPRLRSGGGPLGWSRQPAAARRRRRPPAGGCSSAHKAALAGDGAGFKGFIKGMTAGMAPSGGGVGLRILLRGRRRPSVWGRAPSRCPKPSLSPAPRVAGHGPTVYPPVQRQLLYTLRRQPDLAARSRIASNSIIRRSKQCIRRASRAADQTSQG